MNNKSCKSGGRPGRYSGHKRKKRLEKERKARLEAKTDSLKWMDPTSEDIKEMQDTLANHRNNTKEGLLRSSLRTASELLTIPGTLAANQHRQMLANPLSHSILSGGKKTRKGKRRISRRHRRASNKKRKTKKSKNLKGAQGKRVLAPDMYESDRIKIQKKLDNTHEYHPTANQTGFSRRRTLNNIYSSNNTISKTKKKHFSRFRKLK